MKRTAPWTLIVCSLLVPIGRAQTVTGSGTPGTIPVFTGTSSIGNSPIVRVNDGIQVTSTSAAINGTSNGSDGVTGVSNSSGGKAVVGFNTSGTGNGGAGVAGFGSAITGLVWGVQGAVDSDPVNPDAVGVQASGFNAFRAFSQTCQNFPPCTPLAGTAGFFATGTGGTILAGFNAQTSRGVFRVDSEGTVFANDFQPFGADFAESLAVSGSRAHYAPGDLLVIDPSGERRLALSQNQYSTLVAGIYSTKPGVLASPHGMGDPALKNEVPLAVVGIVPCKVTAENGPIVAGDLLVTSSTPGHAMKGTDRGRMLGAVVGKALEPMREGTGVIQVLVTLQ
jgi:hypothetical protein